MSDFNYVKSGGSIALREYVKKIKTENAALQARTEAAEARVKELEAENEQQVKRISFITDRMVGQDNRITENQIFMVQSRRRVYGMEPGYCNKYVWIYHGDEVADTDEELEEWLSEVGMTKEEADGHDLIRMGIYDYYESVQPFFSSRGAEAYIKANRHRMIDPRVFVESAYRNDEWQAVRTALLNTPEMDIGAKKVGNNDK